MDCDFLVECLRYLRWREIMVWLNSFADHLFYYFSLKLDESLSDESKFPVYESAFEGFWLHGRTELLLHRRCSLTCDLNRRGLIAWRREHSVSWLFLPVHPLCVRMTNEKTLTSKVCITLARKRNISIRANPSPKHCRLPREKGINSSTWMLTY